MLPTFMTTVVVALPAGVQQDWRRIYVSPPPKPRNSTKVRAVGRDTFTDDKHGFGQCVSSKRRVSSREAAKLAEGADSG